MDQPIRGPLRHQVSLRSPIAFTLSPLQQQQCHAPALQPSDNGALWIARLSSSQRLAVPHFYSQSTAIPPANPTTATFLSLILNLSTPLPPTAQHIQRPQPEEESMQGSPAQSPHFRADSSSMIPLKSNRRKTPRSMPVWNFSKCADSVWQVRCCTMGSSINLSHRGSSSALGRP
jgi:hypothetical protein